MKKLLNISSIFFAIVFISTICCEIYLFCTGIRLDWHYHLNQLYKSKGQGTLSRHLSWTNRIETFPDPEDPSIRTTVGKNGLRKSRETIDKKSDFNVAFVGCSYTFGQGVRDEETMVYLLNKKYKDITFDNYGVCGWGPAQILGQIKEIAKEHKYNLIVYDILDSAVPRSMYLFLAEGSLSPNRWYIVYPYVAKNIFGHYYIHYNDDCIIPFENRLLCADMFARIYIGMRIGKGKHNFDSSPALNWTVKEMERACNENGADFLICCLGGESKMFYPHLNIDSPKIDVTHPLQNTPEYRVMNNINFHPNAKVHAYWAEKFSEWLDSQNYLNRSKNNENR